jgi:hypothetical protein
MVNIILYKRKKIKGKFTIHNLWSTKLLEWSSNDKNDKNNRHTKTVISEKNKTEHPHETKTLQHLTTKNSTPRE